MLPMNSVRSEYSDTSSTPGTSRFGGGGSSGASSSILDSSRFTSSRGSTTRTDFLSNYEQKFLERKAEKKKRREREKRLEDATNNQLTADDKRRADREAERLERKAEMATWLPTNESLILVARNRKRQNNARFQGILNWYPLQEQEQTTSRGTQPLEYQKRHIEIKPCFSSDGPHARDIRHQEEQRAIHAMVASEATALQRRVVDLHKKLSCIEELSRFEVRRRHPKCAPPSRSRTQLAPLSKSQSVSDLPRRNTCLKSMQGRHVVSMSHFFRGVPEEEARAVVAEAAELDMFLESHRRQRRRGRAACVIQSTWRMFRQRRLYKKWRQCRTKTRRTFFQVWVLSHRITKQAQRSVKAKYFRAWRDEVDGAIRLQLIELQLFREAETQPELPNIVMNLVFMKDDDDDAYTRKVLAHPARQSYYTGFVNAAFASVEQLATVNGKNRVRTLKAQHLEARRAVAKRIVQRMFLLWKRVHAEEKRIGLNAQLCIKRAARMAFQHRPMWAREKMLTIIELWARWTAFSRSKRLRVPMPHFSRPLPQWDVWLHNYHERQVRKVKAATKAPLARMKRCFWSFRAFAAFALHKRLTNEKARRYFRSTRSRAVLLRWRDVIAESAYCKKLLRGVLRQWQAYAHRKRMMRPWKHHVVAARVRREHLRAWAAWRNVQLRSCFKREFYRLRLASQPKWRWKVQRLLLVWMDVRSQLHKWKVFVGWKHWVQRRKLFLTLQYHCVSLRRRHLLYGMFGAWRAVVWKQEEEFLEDRLRLSAWDSYKELSPLMSMLFYGCYSDAAAIFGGVPSETVLETLKSSEGADIDVLASREKELRAHHLAIVQGSVIEVRNLILKHHHLINAVDPATGNSALHVAISQIEDPVRRFDIVALLLCEGATTWDKPNRHGLSPKQLAPDNLTKELLERGVYGYHARGVLQRAREACLTNVLVSSEPAESRLVWCLIAIMSAEYKRGGRIGGDIQREWFSELKEELWLRRGRICFASTSNFSASVHRCKAFLNGMKRRLCRSKEDVVFDLWARCQKLRNLPQSSRQFRHPGRPALMKSATRRMLSRDLARMEEKIDLLSWLNNTPEDPTGVSAIQDDSEEKAEEEENESINEKVRLLGEYGAYAKALLCPVLDDEEAERDLVHTFVGVVFSLQFPTEVVLAEAMRLESECDKLEKDVMQGYQAIMRAELRSRGPGQPMGLPLLRYFTESSDAEYFFKRELLKLDVEILQRKLHASGSNRREQDNEMEEGDGDNLRQRSAELSLHIDILLAKAQRKQRKADKKAVSIEERVACLNDAYSRVMLMSSRPLLTASQDLLRRILDARVLLEAERLKLARVRLKLLDWAAEIKDMIALKQSLAAETEQPTLQTSVISDLDDAEIMEKKGFLETQLQQCLLELKSSRPSNTRTEAATTELRRQHKAATRALWTLFTMNLFCSCCCWLVENLLSQETDTDCEVICCDSESQLSSEDKRHEVGEVSRIARKGHGHLSVIIPEPVSQVVANTFAAARKASAAIRESGEPATKRRSSLSNARDILDTMQRSVVASELAEQHINMMREIYTRSSQLLFESERKMKEEKDAWRLQLESEDIQRTRSRLRLGEVTELNPTTGCQESPPSRLLSLDEIGAISGCIGASSSGDNTELHVEHNNMKRELLRRAMVRNRSKRLSREVENEYASQDVDGKHSLRSNAISAYKGAPALMDGVIHTDGTTVDLAFGNFVVGSPAKPLLSPDFNRTRCEMNSQLEEVPTKVLLEALWKRGGAIRRRGESPQIGPVSPISAAKASGFDLFASAEDEMAFNAAFRVMSASKDRRTTPQGRRLSSIGTSSGRGLVQVSSRDQHQAVETSIGGDHLTIREPGTLLESDKPDVEVLNVVDRVTQAHEAQYATKTHSKADSARHHNENDLATVDFTSVVKTTDEVEFFGQDLQQYLDRVRRDSLVDLSEQQEANSMTVGSTIQSAKTNSKCGVHYTPNACAGESSESMATPHIKWDQDSRSCTLFPLHVNTTRLLPQLGSHAAHNSSKVRSQDGAMVSSALDQSEHNDKEEGPRTKDLSQALLLSGKSSVMTNRRRTRAISTAKRRESTLTITNCECEPSTTPLNVSSEFEPQQEPGEALVSPTIPVIRVAVQVNTDRTDLVENRSAAPGVTIAPTHSPKKSNRQHSLSLARCEVTLSLNNTTKSLGLKRRRTIEPSSGPQPSRVIRGKAVRETSSRTPLCLEGVGFTSEITVSHTGETNAVSESPTPKMTGDQKRRLWRNFSVAPISETTQDAYALLYPNMYESSARATTTHSSPRAPDPEGANSVSVGVPLAQQLLLDRRFWSAVEGYKVVGVGGLVALDDKTAKRRRVEAAVAIYREFLSPEASLRLPWLAQCADAVHAVEQALLQAPRSLFDPLQQAAHRHFSLATSES